MKFPASFTGLAFLVGRSSHLLAAVVLVNVAFVGFSNLAAQVSAPSATDVSPTVNAEVSSVINTGSGYDAWTGSAHRQVTDLEVPGAVGSHGLKWVRSYNSASKDNGNGGWSFSYTWRYWGRGWADPQAVVLPDGGIWRPYEPGMKLRLVRSGLSSSTWANLYLEDGSMVYMDGYTDFPDDQHSNTVDYFYPEYVLDPYGRKTILTYEQIYISPNYNTLNLRLVKVTDPSGRFIKITYAGSDNFTWFKVTRVEGSNGSWVNYSWPDAYHFHVDYSDGTTADYTYGDTTYLMDTVCCPGGVCDNCTVTAHATKLITAQDTHADGPMQSIQYEYKSPGAFEGQIRAEHHLASGVAVSTFTSTSCPTHPWSTSPDCPTATQTETRGDGPSRTIYMEQATQHVPLVKRKSDFNGVNEVFTYDSNNYLLTAKDRNGYTTTYTNEPVIGNPTRITHPDGNHIDYTYSDTSNPYYISTVTDELARTITYTRDPTTHLITRIDYPDGAYETFAYNGFGQVLTHRRKNGAFDYAAYDSTGLLIKLWNPTTAASVTDTDPHITLAYYPVGNAWQDRVQTLTYPANSSGLIASETYEYDRDSSGNAVPGRGLVTKITHADGTAKTFTYDSFGNKTSQTDETGNPTTYTYDDYKRVKTAKNALNQTTTNDYTATSGASSYSHTTNSVRKSTSPTGIVTGQTYDNNFRLASKIEAEGSAIAATTTFGYDNNGNQTRMTDPLGHATTTTYDNRNRKKTVTDALSHVTTWNYDTTSNVTSINRPDGTTETKTYDTMHRVLTDTVPQTSTINLITTFVYNLSGTLQKVTDPKAQATTFAYDASDLKTKMTYPDTSYQAWTYDNAKNLISRRTVNGVTQNFTYDNRNRKKTMTWSNGLDSASFGYDGASRLTSASNPTSTVTRTYDTAGRLTLDEQNVTGLGIKDVNYLYNADGNQTRIYVTGASYDYTFSYDAMGRFSTIAPTGSGSAFQYYYDAASNETQRYNFLNGGVTQIYTRDALNRMSRRDVKKGTSTVSYEVYGYDPMSRLTSTSREDATSDSFTYYKDGELNTAQYNPAPTPTPTPTATPTPTPTLTPTPTPTPTATPPPTQCADVTFSESGGCPSSLLVNMRTTTTGAIIFYTKHAGGCVTPTHSGSTPTGSTLVCNSNNCSVGVSPNTVACISAQAYKSGLNDSNVTWDNADDICSAPQESPLTESATSPRSVTYNLDKAGNRINLVDTGVTKSYTINTLNQYTAAEGTTVGNGTEHEITSYKGISYTYINDERLSSVTSGRNTYYLAYDALGRCVKRTLNSITTYYVYDGEKPVLEYNTSGAIVGRNLYGKAIDEILMRTDPTVNGGQPFYYQQDHEGSVTHLTNASGAVIEKYRYDAFGAPTIYNSLNTQLSTSNYGNRFLFTGREYAPTFSFYEYRARAYNPTLGRFMSEDPKGFVRHVGLGATAADWSLGAHPDEAEYNLFRYCGNDPLDFTDPMGLDSPEWMRATIPGQIEWDAAVGNYQARNYGTAAAAFSAMLGQQVAAVLTMGTSMRAQESVQGARVAAQEVSAVIGKFPNYLKIADEIGAKRFNIPPGIWNKMTSAERWAANQKFLDRAIARGGDIVLDKPIKDIGSVSGQLRKELDYLSQRGFQLSKDGSRMQAPIPPPPRLEGRP